ncbi:Dip2/Utp12 domain and WD-repeat protein-like protein [Dinothrombium tinctorium]|uniref:Dip2/Utp12 domain and WD-repeat protein-like protein n=1 Tax=Dinothrombium tinctorium TaxID=1965070 RepID=A0A3S3PB65_9ACAR|nr:Dip2/Utp12 domain and WD-repeat protein-like protein [Dinothrombium tinctorium]RWS08976.1 Dip2/Utp12 domain and WD-repeat protein-like protein [Dinothrombium tinctorium]
MKFSFKFSNVLGSVYNKGTLRFTVDGNSVLSPVGNKVVCYDLKNNKSNAIPIEVDYNFSQLALNPKGTLLLASTEKTQLYMCSLVTGNILHRKDFKKLGTKITALSFSPDGLYYVVCGGNKALVYLTPGIAYSGTGRELSPFKIHKVFKAHFDETLCVAWSANSKLIAVGSKDLTVKIFPIEKFANVPSLINLAGHTGDIVDCFFANNEYDLNLYTLSRNNQICIWEASLKSEQLDNENGENLQYTKVNRFHFNEHLKTQKSVSLTSAAYHSKIKLLVTGFSNGAFLLYELPEFNLIHSLELSTTGSIDSVAINCSGDWIAIGSSVGSGDSMELQKDRSSHSQLIVWEWQSETFILKQSGTGTGITNVCECVSYSPDGSYIASGGTDGKIKLWNSFTGFCFATFAEEHKGPISALHFLSNKGGKVLVSASLDGTVRAFDLHRYRNFRTLTAPSEMRSSQFICLAIDEVGGDFIAAGSQNFFHIFLWSLKTGRHEGPVSGVSFSPTINMLVSCSWDRTVRIWSLFEGPKCTREVISLGNEALSVVFRPDGNQIAVSTLNGNIQFFDPHSAEMCGVGIEGKDDLGMSQSESDLIKDTSKYFSSICYSSDGAYVLGGGSSKYICLYNVQEKLLVKKFGITWNYSMDGMFEYITKRKIAEFGFNLELIKQRAKNSEFAPVALPGVKKGDFSAREANPIIAVNCVQFSPTMRSFIIASTEGILIYSLDTVNSFDPYQLDTNVNPNSVRETLGRNEFSDALIQALKLNEEYLIKEVIESTPVEEISFVLRNLTLNYVEKCLQYLANAIESTKHLELYLIWCNTALKQHGILLKNNNSNTSSLMAVIRLLQRNLSNHFYAIGKICDMNKYYIKFIELASKTRSRINDDSTDDILLEMDVSEN